MKCSRTDPTVLCFSAEGETQQLLRVGGKKKTKHVPQNGGQRMSSWLVMLQSHCKYRMESTETSETGSQSADCSQNTLMTPDAAGCVSSLMKEMLIYSRFFFKLFCYLLCLNSCFKVKIFLVLLWSDQQTDDL